MDAEKEIRFAPLTDGLGFHPFSDGLPYAPASKKSSTTGTGATAAGAPRFAYPPAVPPAPSAAVPPAFHSSSVDAAAERIRRELESLQAQRLETARKIARDMQPKLEIRYGLGYSLERAFAFLLD